MQNKQPSLKSKKQPCSRCSSKTHTLLEKKACHKRYKDKQKKQREKKQIQQNIRQNEKIEKIAVQQKSDEKQEYEGKSNQNIIKPKLQRKKQIIKSLYGQADGDQFFLERRWQRYKLAQDKDRHKIILKIKNGMFEDESQIERLKKKLKIQQQQLYCNGDIQQKRQRSYNQCKQKQQQLKIISENNRIQNIGQQNIKQNDNKQIIQDLKQAPIQNKDQIHEQHMIQEFDKAQIKGNKEQLKQLAVYKNNEQIKQQPINGIEEQQINATWLSLTLTNQQCLNLHYGSDVQTNISSYELNQMNQYIYKLSLKIFKHMKLKSKRKALPSSSQRVYTNKIKQAFYKIINYNKTIQIQPRQTFFKWSHSHPKQINKTIKQIQILQKGIPLFTSLRKATVIKKRFQQMVGMFELQQVQITQFEKRRDMLTKLYTLLNKEKINCFYDTTNLEAYIRGFQSTHPFNISEKHYEIANQVINRLKQLQKQSKTNENQNLLMKIKRSKQQNIFDYTYKKNITGQFIQKIFRKRLNYLWEFNTLKHKQLQGGYLKRFPIHYRQYTTLDISSTNLRGQRNYKYFAKNPNTQWENLKMRSDTVQTIIGKMTHTEYVLWTYFTDISDEIISAFQHIDAKDLSQFGHWLKKRFLQKQRQNQFYKRTQSLLTISQTRCKLANQIIATNTQILKQQLRIQLQHYKLQDLLLQEDMTLSELISLNNKITFIEQRPLTQQSARTISKYSKYSQKNINMFLIGKFKEKQKGVKKLIQQIAQKRFQITNKLVQFDNIFEGKKLLQLELQSQLQNQAQFTLPNVRYEVNSKIYLQFNIQTLSNLLNKLSLNYINLVRRRQIYEQLMFEAYQIDQKNCMIKKQYPQLIEINELIQEDMKQRKQQQLPPRRYDKWDKYQIYLNLQTWYQQGKYLNDKKLKNQWDNIRKPGSFKKTINFIEQMELQKNNNQELQEEEEINTKNKKKMKMKKRKTKYIEKQKKQIQKQRIQEPKLKPKRQFKNLLTLSKNIQIELQSSNESQQQFQSPHIQLQLSDVKDVRFIRKKLSERQINMNKSFTETQLRSLYKTYEIIMKRGGNTFQNVNRRQKYIWDFTKFKHIVFDQHIQKTTDTLIMSFVQQIGKFLRYKELNINDFTWINIFNQQYQFIDCPRNAKFKSIGRLNHKHQQYLETIVRGFVPLPIKFIYRDSFGGGFNASRHIKKHQIVGPFAGYIDKYYRNQDNGDKYNRLQYTNSTGNMSNDFTVGTSHNIWSLGPMFNGAKNQLEANIQIKHFITKRGLQLWLVAKRDIFNGQHLVWNYGKTYDKSVKLVNIKNQLQKQQKMIFISTDKKTKIIKKKQPIQMKKSKKQNK